MAKQTAAPDGEVLREMCQKAAKGTLSDLLGMEVLSAERARLTARLKVGREHLGPTGFVHAGTVVTIADTCAGMGCVVSFPEHARGFTTIELKTNFPRSAKADDVLVCEARMVHAGRTTQVWDVTVTRESDGEVVGLYRATQMLLTERRWTPHPDTTTSDGHSTRSSRRTGGTHGSQ
jgi:1,4-dihydroxy-2-naphthoyl-CoA hydrolase